MKDCPSLLPGEGFLLETRSEESNELRTSMELARREEEELEYVSGGFRVLLWDLGRPRDPSKLRK